MSRRGRCDETPSVGCHIQASVCFRPMKMIVRRLLKLHWFVCYEQFDRSKKKVITRIYHIYTWKKVLQQPNFLLLTKLCDASVLLLAEMYSKFDRNASNWTLRSKIEIKCYTIHKLKMCPFCEKNVTWKLLIPLSRIPSFKHNLYSDWVIRL